jgi:hypothetical protein
MADDGQVVVTGPWEARVDYEIESSIYDCTPSDVEPTIIKIEPKPLPAVKILQDSIDLISGERQEQHGDPKTCHDEIAKAWTWWTGFKIDAHDVAMMMMLLKAARVKTGGYNRDCYTDGAAYFSLGGQMRTESE